jgi:hypothetical protein
LAYKLSLGLKILGSLPAVGKTFSFVLENGNGNGNRNKNGNGNRTCILVNSDIIVETNLHFGTMVWFQREMVRERSEGE